MTTTLPQLSLSYPQDDPALAPLSPGDKVALICPSGPPTPENLRRAEELLTSWGLTVVTGPHASSMHPRASYLAGSDSERAADLTWAYTDPEIAAVFCARGGYGAIRLLDLLDPRELAAHRKPLYGSSDITALHEYWQTRLATPTWFTPMPATADLLLCPTNTAGLRAACMGEPLLPLVCDGAVDAATEILVPGCVTAEVTGGNLSLLAMSSASSPLLAERARGRIVLLEEVHESCYRVDGLMQILLRQGYFAECAGVVLGTWEDCGAEEQIKELMVELLSPLGVPVVWGARFGHGPRVSSFPLGTGVQLRLEAR